MGEKAAQKQERVLLPHDDSCHNVEPTSRKGSVKPKNSRDRCAPTSEWNPQLVPSERVGLQRSGITFGFSQVVSEYAPRVTGMKESILTSFR